MMPRTSQADHLSRLETRMKNVLDPKEINEHFPLETSSDVCTGKEKLSTFPRRLPQWTQPGIMGANLTANEDLLLPASFGRPTISTRMPTICQKLIARIVKALVFSVLSIRSLKLQSSAFILGIRYPNLID
ncbi:hypothetical protein Tco_1193367 [Tanacetum coccineum]